MEILIVFKVAFHWIWIKLLEYLYKDLESIDIATSRLLQHQNTVIEIVEIIVFAERRTLYGNSNF